MNHITQYQLEHIQQIMRNHLMQQQNKFQPIKHHPESSLFDTTRLEIEKTQNTLSAIGQEINEYRLKDVR